MSSKKIKRVPRNDRQIRKLYGKYMGVNNTYSKTMQLFTHSEQRTRILKNYVFWKSLATIFGGKHNKQLLVFTQQTATCLHTTNSYRSVPEVRALETYQL